MTLRIEKSTGSYGRYVIWVWNTPMFFWHLKDARAALIKLTHQE